ncbi:MAG: GNAT family N-acetyltransferase [Chloroflexi bacterium]|nr:MAG: GNAT family N-acetyltransferase [Chloroflexota bacterium]
MKSLQDLIGNIYPEALDFIRQGKEEGSLVSSLHFPSPDNAGAFCIVSKPEFTVSYLSFESDLKEVFLREIIWAEIEPHLQADFSDHPFYLNVYGRNSDAIRWAQEAGFRKEMHGYKLGYRGELPEEVSINGLQVRGYEEQDLQAIIILFDRAYQMLNQANGWRTNWHALNAASFRRHLIERQKFGEFVSFWDSDTLVGAYIIQGIYLSDIAVDPDHQNRGLGALLLTHSLRKMLVEKEVKDIRLNVAYSNTGAKRFYERHGFIEIGCFADHIFMPQLDMRSQADDEPIK